ncbi:MAG TPA: helix-turn-helix domain-containing protein [Bryobacteraceae bacterium]|nr:helix-turn-helix domain-containing protein [Bryobacteraceae bacterium]
MPYKPAVVAGDALGPSDYQNTADRVIVPIDEVQSSSGVFDAAAFRRRTLGYLSEIELASMMGITVKTLRNWRSAQIGPRWTKFGRQVMYPISGLESLLEEQTIAPSTEERKMGIPIQNCRVAPSVKPHRLGGYRTKQEKSRAA